MFRVLTSDGQNLREVYDKQGLESMNKVAQGGMEDPASFFAAVFGGERFYDYVRLPLGPTGL